MIGMTILIAQPLWCLPSLQALGRPHWLANVNWNTAHWLFMRKVKASEQRSMNKRMILCKGGIKIDLEINPSISLLDHSQLFFLIQKLLYSFYHQPDRKEEAFSGYLLYPKHSLKGFTTAFNTYNPRGTKRSNPILQISTLRFKNLVQNHTAGNWQH